MKAKHSPTDQMIALITMFTALAFIVTALPASAQEVVVLPEVEYSHTTGYTTADAPGIEYYTNGDRWLVVADSPQDPPEIRIMKRIIQAALEEVEAPELPEELLEGADSRRAFVSTGSGWTTSRDTRYVSAIGIPGNFSMYSGSQKVTGFYMEGYGYLFTIKWPIRHSNLLSSFSVGGTGEMVIALEAQNRALEEILLQREDRRSRAEQQVEEPEAVAEAEQTAEARRQEIEALAARLEEWQAEFEDSIIDELKNVMATYGHTLARASENEKITFVFQPGDDEAQNITLSVERSSLAGPGETDASLRAITVARGSAESNPALKSQIRIMSEIIDAAFDEEDGESGYYSLGSQSYRGYYFGGESGTQYIPGYGVIFTRSARMNLVTMLEETVPMPPAAPAPDAPPATARSRAAAGAAEERQAREAYRGLMSLSGSEVTEASREKLLEHFQNLKQKTAEILATYGTTLTELDADEYVGINYEVGSSAGLLQSGVTNYMVLAKMSDVLQALRQSDGAAWLMERLITNEKIDDQ